MFWQIVAAYLVGWLIAQSLFRWAFDKWVWPNSKIRREASREIAQELARFLADQPHEFEANAFKAPTNGVFRNERGACLSDGLDQSGVDPSKIVIIKDPEAVLHDIRGESRCLRYLYAVALEQGPDKATWFYKAVREEMGPGWPSPIDEASNAAPH